MYAIKVLISAAVTTLCVMVSAPIEAQPSSPPTSTLENPEPVGSLSDATLELSTRDARLQVEPLDWNVTRGDVSPEAQASEELSSTPPGPPGSTSGAPPNPDADQEAESQHDDQWRGIQGLDADSLGELSDAVNFGTQDVFTQYCENCSNSNLSYPQRAVGKLFTSSGSCSASVVSGENVIVTAAHCCYDRRGGDWIRGWSFAPAYRDGFAPLGMFDWSSATILTRWINVGDRKSDVCAIKLRPGSNGRDVTFYTGWLGRSWNFPVTQVHHAAGYPGNIGGGNKLELCVSESFNPTNTCGGASVLNTGCSMTFGASGGPWVRHYRNGNWVNSVVSGYDNSVCTGSFGSTFNGPRFTSDNIVPICNAIGC